MVQTAWGVRGMEKFSVLEKRLSTRVRGVRPRSVTRRPGTHRLQRQNGTVRTLAVLACTLLTGCFGSDHPDSSRYEYLYMDGAFVPPYKDFPSGRERQEWQCYDAKTKQTFACTFVRSGWDNFQYIFRERHH